MTQPADIDDDLTRILALTKAALSARDDAAKWQRSPEKQIGHHAACCDALWTELERMVQISEGITPTLEHPEMRRRRIAKNIRSELITAAIAGMEDVLMAATNGTYDWEGPGPFDMGEEI